MINEILQEESCFTLKDLAVNGHDMMTLGFQGPTIGRVLQECLDAVLDEQIPNEHEALMAFAKDRQLKELNSQNGNTACLYAVFGMHRNLGGL